MGFKDLVRFNEAILTKQIWRLQTNKNSLLYKVFSTKYLPTSSVFEAKSKKGSFACQSILKARHVIEKGMLWRVADGSQIWVSMTIGFLGVFQQRQYHSRKLLETPVFVHSLIRQQRTGMGK